MDTATARDRALVDAVSTAAGTRLGYEGRADRGTSGGAVLVVLPDGRPGVLTRFLGPLSQARDTALVLDEARRQGLPVPRHHFIAQVGPDVLVVQERLPGQPPDEATPDVVAAVIGINERFVSVLRACPDVPTVPLCLSRSGHPHPRHEVLARHSDRSRRVLERIRSLAGGEVEEAVGDDLLHIDLTLDNILFDDAGSVTGVVDWNLGAHRGDRHLALVKTRFDLEWALREPGTLPECAAAAEHLDSHLAATVEEGTLLRYWAHRVLYQLHWILQSGPQQVIDWHLELAETKLGLERW
ncbi:phosphotransferase [Desertihabitans aurantiacus]|uniref:phosphotransferase n=1 Tax=Desertihabitans aurantiacus TaxID=2282477 RepID=UPI001300BA3B|nr:phosphotransferase [Desertihabitans aurantiacus]